MRECDGHLKSNEACLHGILTLPADSDYGMEFARYIKCAGRKTPFFPSRTSGIGLELFELQQITHTFRHAHLFHGLVTARTALRQFTFRR